MKKAFFKKTNEQTGFAYSILVEVQQIADYLIHVFMGGAQVGGLSPRQFSKYCFELEHRSILQTATNRNSKITKIKSLKDYSEMKRKSDFQVTKIK